MPGAAELAEAKQLFQTKTNDNDLPTVELLRREPAFWHQEALYLLGTGSSRVEGHARTPGALLAPQPRGPADVAFVETHLGCVAEPFRQHSCYAAQCQNATLAASLKQQPLLQLKKDCLKDFQGIFRLHPEPTLAFVRDLGDVLGRWWLGRTDTHAAVRVTAPREVLLGEDVLVEHTQAIKLQRLRKEYKQCNADQELVPRKWASRHRKKQNVFRLWEEDCAKAIHEKDFQRLLLPRGLALDQTVGSDPSCVRQVPDWGALIRDCFKPPDGDFFVLWLVQQVRACRPMQERPVQSWLCLAGQVPLLLKQILRSYCQILGDEHVAVFRDDAKDHDSACKNADPELQQSLLVVLDAAQGTTFRPRGTWQKKIKISNWSQVLVLPDANGEPLWTAEQLRQECLASTLLQLAEPASIKSLPDMPSSEELAQYLHACALEHLALSESSARSVPFITSSQASEDVFEQWESAFRRDVNQFKLPGLDKQTETVFCVGQGTNVGRLQYSPSISWKASKAFWVSRRGSKRASQKAISGSFAGKLFWAGPDEEVEPPYVHFQWAR
eukprot:g48751.t1